MCLHIDIVRGIIDIVHGNKKSLTVAIWLWVGRCISRYSENVPGLISGSAVGEILLISSVPNSSSGFIFVKIQAESGRIFSENLGKIRAKIRAKLNFVILSSFYDLGHVQTGILRFGEQLHNALNVH